MSQAIHIEKGDPCESPFVHAGQRLLFPKIGVEKRGSRAQKQARVVVLGVVEHLFGGSPLDSLTVVHDDDAVGDIAHCLNVVADEDHGKAELLLQVHEQVQNLRAN